MVPIRIRLNKGLDLSSKRGLTQPCPTFDHLMPMISPQWSLFGQYDMWYSPVSGGTD